MANASNDQPAALILATGSRSSVLQPEAFGLTPAERLRRSLIKAGVSRIDSFDTSRQVEDILRDGGPGPSSERFILLRDDYFYDERLIAGLMEVGDCLLASPDETAPARFIAATASRALVTDAAAALAASGSAGVPNTEPATELRQVDVLDVAPAYNAALRRFDPPFAHAARHETARATENQIFGASYKGLTDLVTKWVFPVPARAIVRVLARRGVRPNTVTAWSYALAIATGWLFAEGWFATGLLLGWIMTFLDTVDGKLARCTITSSRIGDIADHGLDLVHPPIWWAAFAVGLPGGIEGHALAFWVVVGGYVVGRALEGIFLGAFGMEFFLWRRFDGFFRTIIARRNPNLILLTLGVAASAPAAGYDAVAVWTAVCILIAAARNLQAWRSHARGIAIRPWREAQAPSTESQPAPN